MALALRKPARGALAAVAAVVFVGGSDRPARADALATSEVRLTWPDVARLAASHPRAVAARTRVMEARAEVEVAGAIPNPSLDVSVGRGHAQSGDDQRTEWAAAVQVPLSWAARRGPAMTVAEDNAASAEQDARAEAIDVLLGLNGLFWEVAAEQQLVADLDALVAQTSSLADAVGRRVDKGEARPIERLKIDVERERIRSEAEASHRLLESRAQQLGAWLGLDGRSVVVSADIGMVPRVPELAQLRVGARSGHPQAGAAEARVRAANAEVKAQQRGWIPEVSVRGFTQSELDRRSFGGGVTLDVPVWNWNGAGVSLAKARLAAAVQQRELLARELDARIVEKYGECASASALANGYRDRLVPSAKQSAEVAETSYRLGEIGLLDVIDSRRVLIDTRKSFVAAATRAHAACEQVSILAGREVAP